MSSTIEFRVLELLCSRLCHDLISPVTAVNNGMELMAEDSGDMTGDIRDLISSSAAVASNRLQFYRIAYGLGGQSAAPVGLAEAGRLARGLTEDGKVSLDWPDGSGDGDDSGLSRATMKLLLNLVLLGIEALPRGGMVSVAVIGDPPAELAVTASGVGSRLHDESIAALAPGTSVEDLSARSVQAYFVRHMAGQQGAELALEPGVADALTLRLRLAG